MAIKRVYKTKEEILDLLERVFKVSSQLQFSQERDKIVKASWSLVKNINFHSYDMAIRPTDSHDNFEFTETKDIIVKNDSGNISFKTKITSINHKNLIIVEIPEELELLDSRSAQRYDFEEYKIRLSFKNKS